FEYSHSLRKSLAEEEIAARIEAALYSAGRPLSLDDLIKASGTDSKEKTRRVIVDLAKKAKETFRAIEIAQLEDGRYVFQLRPEYTPLVRKFAQHPLLPSAALKTLSYIAYEQPVTSKRLVQIRGSQVYSHIKVLEQLQFIEHENLGRLKVYRTTPKFQSYFGITDLNVMKSKLVATTTTNKQPRLSTTTTTTTRTAGPSQNHHQHKDPRPPEKT
ncbi:MAG TPA: SMC-Scp complex subunit ScpB, partial [Nitrososphaera sp.]|nr:SMC-Scp complex subunit ScpB [Nitrososphaera sp.]